MSTETPTTRLSNRQIENMFVQSSDASHNKRSKRAESLAASKRFRALMAALTVAAGLTTVEVAKQLNHRPAESLAYEVQPNDTPWTIANKLRKQHRLAESPAEFGYELTHPANADAARPTDGIIHPGDEIVVTDGHVTGYKY